MGFFSTTFGKIVSSKTVWRATLLGLMGVLPTIAPMVPAGTWESAAIATVLAAFTVYSRIQAKQPLGPVIDQTIAQTVEAVHQLGISAEGAPTSIAGQVQQIAAVAAVVKAK